MTRLHRQNDAHGNEVIVAKDDLGRYETKGREAASAPLTFSPSQGDADSATMRREVSISGLHEDEYLSDERGVLRDRYGFDRYGYTDEGVDRYGFDRYGERVADGSPGALPPHHPLSRLGKKDATPEDWERAKEWTASALRDANLDRDADGFDSDGMDADGFDAEGRNLSGFDREGFNAEGFNAWNGLGRGGFGRNGRDADGFNRNGVNRFGLTRDEVAVDEAEKAERLAEFRAGFKAGGFNAAGMDAEGFDTEGFHVLNGYNRDGFNRDGFGRDGLDADGFDRRGYSKFKHDKNGNPDYLLSSTDTAALKRLHDQDQERRADKLALPGFEYRAKYRGNGEKRLTVKRHPGGFDGGFSAVDLPESAYERDADGTPRDGWGFDPYGLDSAGRDRWGMDEFEFDTEGYDWHGFDETGRDRNGNQRDWAGD